MIIKTPSGYEVTLKDSLTFGESRILQRSLISGAKVEIGENKKAPEIDLANAFEYTELALPYLVISIKKDDKLIEGDCTKEIMGWPQEDGQAVFDKLDEILRPVDKKK